MARINDVGGTQGFGAIDTSDDAEPFHADWEARVVGLFNALRAQGIFNTNEFRDAIESLPPAEYLATSYYMVLPRRPDGTEGLTEEELANLVTRNALIGTAAV